MTWNLAGYRKASNWCKVALVGLFDVVWLEGYCQLISPNLANTNI
jgi:hypothetical protein